MFITLPSSRVCARYGTVIPTLSATGRHYCQKIESDKITASYQLLGVTEDSDLDAIRDSYLKLAKKYHPDSGSKTADSQKFAKIEEAYRIIVNHHQQKAATKQNDEETTVFDIHHTAPQHRQYLNYEGVGFGPPSKREQQYKQHRVMRAAENVMDYKMAKLAAASENTMVVKDKADSKKKKIRSAIDRLVEDLILESMAKGEFDNLPGKGKPLAYYNHNPMVDTTTHNLNRILIENGYAPEWVMLKREISRGIQESRAKLLAARLRAGKNTASEHCSWQKDLAIFREDLASINKNINKYNMVVPSLHQQLIPYDVNKEISRVLLEYQDRLERGEVTDPNPSQVVYKQRDPEEPIRLSDVFREIKALFSSG